MKTIMFLLQEIGENPEVLHVGTFLYHKLLQIRKLLIFVKTETISNLYLLINFRFCIFKCGVCYLAVFFFFVLNMFLYLNSMILYSMYISWYFVQIAFISSIKLVFFKDARRNLIQGR